jgi:Cysteine-rich CPCC
MENDMPLACPVCGFLTIEDDFYGTYDVCPVCEWEDDQVQLANPACKGGANTDSLIESQKRILKKVPLELKEFKGFRRDITWRPLNKREIAKFEKERRIQHWKNKGVLSTDEVYWTKKSGIPSHSTGHA